MVLLCDTYAVNIGYMLLGLLESLGLRAVKDALPDNPRAQEQIMGATLFAMAVADVCIVLSDRFAVLTY